MKNPTTGFLIAYEVKECKDKVKGFGVFAKEDIPKGTMTWQPTTLVGENIGFVQRSATL